MKKKGAALLTVVIVTSIIFVVAVSVLDRSLKTYRDSTAVLDDNKAYYTAESLIYDMVGYIDSRGNAVNKDTEFKIADVPGKFKGLVPNGVTSIDVHLTTDVVCTYNSGTRKEYTYNIESTVQYNGINYVVKMQIKTTYESGLLTGHSIIERKAYKI